MAKPTLAALEAKSISLSPVKEEVAHNLNELPPAQYETNIIIMLLI